MCLVFVTIISAVITFVYAIRVDLSGVVFRGVVVNLSVVKKSHKKFLNKLVSNVPRSVLLEHSFCETGSVNYIQLISCSLQQQQGLIYITIQWVNQYVVVFFFFFKKQNTEQYTKVCLKLGEP